MRVRLCAIAFLAATLALGCGENGGGASASATATTAAAPTATPDGGAPTAGPSAAKGVRLKRIGTFDSPVYVTAPAGDGQRIFVVEQGGTIRVLVGGKRRATPFLDIRDRVTAGGERGLLSMAFAPDYATSGLFYVYYTDRNGDTRVVEYHRASADRADAGSARQVLFQRQPEPNHNGGPLVFGPDRLLYIGLGDGGGGGDLHGPRGNGQNLGTLLGKILRIDPRASGGRAYSIPGSNPFVGRSGARGEIWAYGLRNPWRFTFDPRSKAAIIADVGENAVEEVSIAQAGANLGWRVFEGRSRYTEGESAPAHVPPVIERLHSNGNCSLTGGIVVRDPGLPALGGRYVFGDFCKGRVESALIRGSKARSVRRTRLQVDSLSSFGEDGRRRAYAVSLDGPVYRLVPRR
jgi:glucose/arabinose dehydrogenase